MFRRNESRQFGYDAVSGTIRETDFSFCLDMRVYPRCIHRDGDHGFFQRRMTTGTGSSPQVEQVSRSPMVPSRWTGLGCLRRIPRTASRCRTPVDPRPFPVPPGAPVFTRNFDDARFRERPGRPPKRDFCFLYTSIAPGWPRIYNCLDGSGSYRRVGSTIAASCPVKGRAGLNP